MNDIHRFDLMQAAKFCQGVLSIGTGEGHGGLEPRNVQDTHTRLLRRGLFVGARDDGYVVSALGEMTCQMVDHRANASPARRILARDHGNVHAENHKEPAFECH